MKCEQCVCVCVCVCVHACQHALSLGLCSELDCFCEVGHAQAHTSTQATKSFPLVRM